MSDLPEKDQAAPDHIWGELRSALSNWDAEAVDSILDNWIWGDWHEAMTYAKAQNWKPRSVRTQKSSNLNIEWVQTDPSPENVHFEIFLNQQAFSLAHMSIGASVYERTKRVKTWIVVKRDSQSIDPWNYRSGFWGIPVENALETYEEDHPWNDPEGTPYKVFDVEEAVAEYNKAKGISEEELVGEDLDDQTEE